jgi:hypothetical protein
VVWGPNVDRIDGRRLNVKNISIGNISRIGRPIKSMCALSIDCAGGVAPPSEGENLSVFGK